MNARCNVFFADNIGVDHLLHQSCSRDPLVRVVGNVADLGAHEELVPLVPILPYQRLECSANRPFAFLAPIVDGRVKHIDASGLYHQLDCVVLVEVCLIIRRADVGAETY